MKHIYRHILICLSLFYGSYTYASHVLGGELFYKHIKDNQYKVTLNIYRDCNGCKINGNGGGSTIDNCSEIDYLYVKGTDNTNAAETKFTLTREKIADVTPLCKSKISVCNSSSNSIFGIELQQFSAIIDLDNYKIKGFCNYYLYVSFAERNNAITTGAAKQNFCIDAFIQTCLDSKNNSPNFVSSPTFIINANKTQYQSYFATDSDKDSLVYSLAPALFDINKEVNYYSGFNYSNPLTVYCTDITPCNSDKFKETGFYFDQSNGTTVFIPTKDSEIGIVAVKVEEYRKISGKWELIGYIKRDIQVYVKTSDGNSSPKFLNKDYYEICEEEPLTIKVETTDAKNSFTMVDDSVNYFLSSSINGSSFSQITQNTAPYNYGLFKWTPAKGASTNQFYSFSVSAIDNFCPLNAVSSQIILIKVKPKEELKVKYTDLGCGNFELQASNFNIKSNLTILLFNAKNPNKELFYTNLPHDTISSLPQGKFILKSVLSSFNGCETILIDTIYNLTLGTSAFISGKDSLCKGTDYSFIISKAPLTKFTTKWIYSGENIGNINSITNRFDKDGQLNAILTFHLGKWICTDTLRKNISVIVLPKILSNERFEICHKSENFNLKNFAIIPSDGQWSSSNPAFSNGIINTNFTPFYYNDTILLNYKITQSGCTASKDIPLVLLAVPEFELSSISICEIKTPVLFEHFISKPYKISDYSFVWELPLFPDKIKEENGYKLFYPNEIGFGKLEYQGELTASNGCKNRDTAFIEITPAVHITFENEINLCQQSGVIDITKLSGVKPNNGNWSFIDFRLFNDKTSVLTDTCGQFEVSYVYDNYGCYDLKTVIVKIACKPEIKINGLKNTICDSELPVTLSANPLGGSWQGNNTSGNSFNPPLLNTAQKHSLSYIIKEGNCNFTETQNVNILPSPHVNFSPNKLNFCNSESILISGSVLNSNSINFLYSGKSTELKTSRIENFESLNIIHCSFEKGNISQSLLAKAMNSEGCETLKEFSINVYDNPKIEAFKDTTICQNSDYIITPIIKYLGDDELINSWIENGNKIGNETNFNTNQLEASKHNLSFHTRNLFCTDSISFNLYINPKPLVNFSIQPSDRTTIMQPYFWFLNHSEPNLSWLWDFGTTHEDNYSIEESPKYSYTDTGNYEVLLNGTNIFGCLTLVSKMVVVRPDLLIFIPNAFTPNNKDEEKNNVFSVSLENYNSYFIEIFDRWGNRVFTSENPKETWDGKAGSIVCTPDVYFYSIKINSITNHKYLYRGTITLIK